MSLKVRYRRSRIGAQNTRRCRPSLPLAIAVTSLLSYLTEDSVPEGPRGESAESVPKGLDVSELASGARYGSQIAGVRSTTSRERGRRGVGSGCLPSGTPLRPKGDLWCTRD